MGAQWPRRIGSRGLPGLATILLLCLAAASPAPPASGPAPPPMFYPPCESPISTGAGESTFVLPGAHGVTQPLPSGISAASCSLRVITDGVDYIGADLVEWDPLTLAPDPRSVALRTFDIDPSRLLYNGRLAAQAIVPPLVTRSLDHVAEPPRLTTALRVVSWYASNNGMSVYYDPASGSSLPGALEFAIGTGNLPLPGPHPVFAHAICGGDPDLQSLRVAQSVMRTSGGPSARGAELAQRFRVPEPVELRWIELASEFTGEPALATAGTDNATAPRMPAPQSSTVAILDGAALAAPVPIMPASLVEAPLAPDYTANLHWVAHSDFDQTITLSPGHDYWLYISSTVFNRLDRATLTGAESADFTSEIGPYYERDYTTGLWARVPGSVLAFKIIGRPTAFVGERRPPLLAGGLTLQVAPNPVRDRIQASWSGGVGPVRLELLDARGGRVATGTGGAGGAWQWAALDARGRPLSAGVYFLHARDSDGGHAVERVVVVR